MSLCMNYSPTFFIDVSHFFSVIFFVVLSFCVFSASYLLLLKAAAPCQPFYSQIFPLEKHYALTLQNVQTFKMVSV